MKSIEYIYYLSSDYEDRLRVVAYKEKNKILEFVVQYEASIRGKWHSVVRYDTHHGFAHRDLLYPDGSSEKTPLEWDYALALTYATEELKRNWKKYRQIFEEKLNDKK